MKLLFVFAVLLVPACSLPTATVSKTSAGLISVSGKRTKAGEVISYSFVIPDAEVIEFNEIRAFHQSVALASGGEIVGGKPVGGYISRDAKRQRMDIRLLGRSPCACRHVELHELNGQYAVEMRSNENAPADCSEPGTLPSMDHLNAVPSSR